MTFGEKLRELRKEKHLTQEKLADLAGVHTNTISQWENGVVPHMKNIIELARILDTTSEYLTGTVEQKKGKNSNKSHLSKVTPTLRDYSYIEKLVAANQMIVYENPGGERFFIPATTEGANFYERIRDSNRLAVAR